MNIFYQKKITHELDSDVSLYDFIMKHKKFIAGILPVSAFPYLCFPSRYKGDYEKILCIKRNINSLLMIFHFICLSIIGIFFSEDFEKIMNIIILQ